MSFGFGLRLQSATGWTLASAVQSLFGFGEQGVWYDVNDPNLGWRRNKLTWTEQFDNAAWTKTRSSVTANATTAPDGTTTADALIEDSTAANSHTIRIVPTVTAQAYTFSAYCKANQRSWVRLVNASAVNSGAYFDLSTGAVGSVGSAATAEIVDVGNGWYRCSVTAVAISGGNSFDIRLAESDFGDFYDGDGTSGIYVWGAQLEEASTASTYQRITSGGTADFTALTGTIPTLFQDYQGVTPCSTPGQGVAMPVGLMLDKHKGLVLGDELVTNGDFESTATGSTPDTWQTNNANASLIKQADGTALFSSTSFAYAQLKPANYLSLTAGKFYEVSFELSEITGTLLNVHVGIGTSGNVITGNGHYSYIYLAATTTTYDFQIRPNAGGTGSLKIDNISVREVPGNHAYQSTSASRPALSGRYNLLTYTEQFDNAAWTVKVNPVYGVEDANGGTAAVRLTSDASNQIVLRQSNYQVVSGTEYTHRIAIRRVSGTGVISLTTSNNTVTDITSQVSSSWGYISLTALNVIGTGANGYFILRLDTSGDSIEVCFPDARASNDSLNIPAYQRVVDALTYDTTGFPLYLSCDGFDDWMATNSIDFSASDKMFVAAGVRKLSDAARGIIVESGINVGGVEDGTFLIDGPGLTPASDSFRFVSRGTFAAPTTAGAAYPAPISSVVAGLGDISGDSAVLRVNGVEVASDTTDQGTGNFGNYPLYLFRRAGTTYPFTGRFYNLVVRGGALPSDAQIAQVETYLNKTTQAY